MSKSNSEKARRELKKVKHTVKLLSHSPDSKITRAILAASPDGVIRAIANAALNVQRNPVVKLDPATRNLFSTYSRSFEIHTDRNLSIERKRKHLTQKGGAIPFLLPLLGSALFSLGIGFIFRFSTAEEAMSNAHASSSSRFWWRRVSTICSDSGNLRITPRRYGLW